MNDAVREQIKRDANDYAHLSGHPDTIFVCRHHFWVGAIHQHPVSFEAGKKEARKEIIDKVLRELAHYKDLFEYKDDYTELVKEIVKLRNPKIETEIKK